MINAKNIITIILFVVLILGVGGIFLQIFLAKKESKWLGLILPIISFLFSLAQVLTGVTRVEMQTAKIISSIISTLLITNIPTIVYLGIYFHIKEKMKTIAQLERMNIQDLD